VFLGYSSKARSTAQAVHLFLKERLGLRVRNWEIDFAAAGIILDEIETAARLCSGGIFLFTKDDAFEGNEIRAAPRDNVVFEAGYFAAAKGRDRVLIIRVKTEQRCQQIWEETSTCRWQRETISVRSNLRYVTS
jgi:predicted nucleotide-binding protein